MPSSDETTRLEKDGEMFLLLAHLRLLNLNLINRTESIGLLEAVVFVSIRKDAWVCESLISKSEMLGRNALSDGHRGDFCPPRRRHVQSF